MARTRMFLVGAALMASVAVPADQPRPPVIETAWVTTHDSRPVVAGMGGVIEQVRTRAAKSDADAKMAEDGRSAEAARAEAAHQADLARQTAERAAETTTTMRAPVTTLAPVRPSSPVTAAPVTQGGGACGGNLPPCSIMMRESRGNPTAVNSSGCGGRGCYGKWQFDPKTSESLGYAETMDQYPEAVQDQAAATLYAELGCAPWGGC